MVQTGISNHPPNSSSANPMRIFRLVILSLCGIMSIANIGLVIHWIVITEESFKRVQSFETTGLIACIFTLVLVPALIIVSRTRASAWIVYTLTEITVFGVLWILWVVAAANVIKAVKSLGDCSQGIEEVHCTETGGFEPQTCTNATVPPSQSIELCTEAGAIKGLSVTIFVLLLIYVLTLIIIATLRSLSRGSSVWFQPVQDLQISSSNSTVHMMTQTTTPGSSGVGREKASPDMNTGVPVTAAHPNGMGPNRTGYPAHVASPSAEV